LLYNWLMFVSATPVSRLFLLSLAGDGMSVRHEQHRRRLSPGHRRGVIGFCWSGVAGPGRHGPGRRV
jgi:hypothetical protein